MIETWEIFQRRVGHPGSFPVELPLRLSSRTAMRPMDRAEMEKQGEKTLAVQADRGGAVAGPVEPRHTLRGEHDPPGLRARGPGHGSCLPRVRARKLTASPCVAEVFGAEIMKRTTYAWTRRVPSRTMARITRKATSPKEISPAARRRASRIGLQSPRTLGQPTHRPKVDQSDVRRQALAAEVKPLQCDAEDGGGGGGGGGL